MGATLVCSGIGQVSCQEWQVGLLIAEPSRALLSFLFTCAVYSKGLEFHKCVSSGQLRRTQARPGHTPPDGLLWQTSLWTQRVGLKRAKTSDFRSGCFAVLITCSHTQCWEGAPGQDRHAPCIWGAGPPSPSKPSLLVLHFNQWLFSSLNLLHTKEF